MSDKGYCSTCHAKSQFGEPLKHFPSCNEAPIEIGIDKLRELNQALNALRLEILGSFVDDLQRKVRETLDLSGVNCATPNRSSDTLEKLCVAAKKLVSEYERKRRVFQLDLADFRDVFAPILSGENDDRTKSTP